MKEKDIKKEVKRLAKQKKFEQIYLEYGPKYFRKYVTHSYKSRDIKKLIEEGKYIDIYAKYGENYWRDALFEDSYYELGREMTLKEQIIWDKGFRKTLQIPPIIAGIVGIIVTPLLKEPIDTEIEKAKNAREYAKEINEYEKELKEYAKKFDMNSQSDMEIIMRMMKDMHETIIGYGEPKMDIVGYRGMDVMNEDGIGVCRNMAENMVDKLNEVNSEYNARIVTLYMKIGDLTEANIEHNLIEENVRKNIKDNVKKIYVDEQLEQTIIEKEDIRTIYEYEKGVMIRKTIQTPDQLETISYDRKGEIIQYRETIKEDDDENGQIYKTYIDGKLTNESEINKDYHKETRYDDNGQVISQTIENIEKESEKSAEEKQEGEERKQEEINHAIVAIDIKKDHVTLLIDPVNLSIGIFKDGKIQMFNEEQLEQAIYDRSWKGDSSYKGIQGIIDYPIDYIKSFMEPTLSMKELEEKYGLEAQNRMLEKIEKEDSKKTFKQQLKIYKGITYDFDDNVVTIDNSERKEEEQKEY